MSDTEAIRALIEARGAALEAGDTAAFVAVLADDIVSYDLQPPLSYSGAAARDTAGTDAWLATWEGPVVVTLADPAIRIDGDLAVAFGLSRMTGTKRGAAPSVLWFRTTIVLARHGDGWRVVHEHNSLPMMMDGSGLAAVDLTPADSITGTSQ